MDFSSQVALVTGAASGIGLSTAQRFAGAGAAVTLFDIDGPAVRTAAAALPRAFAFTGDVSSEDDARTAVEQTIAQFGRLDILVNNAAIELNGDVTQLSIENWDRQIAVNLRGAYLLARFAVPHLAARGGSIVNIASVHAFISWHGCPAYDASKAGLLALTRAMALDHGPEGIRVNAICPGYTETPLMEKALRNVPDRSAAMQKILSSHPLGRIGTAADIAGAVLFLASPAASFITGSTLVVDGGFSVFGH
jgi:meso-butanediol dehydrogenase / (S,S)-butanediol dehydrogenase / diacetyl reductase